MWRYVLKRLGWMIVTTLGVALIIFTVLYLTPGNPAEYMLGSTATAEEIANLETKLGIDKPYLQQLATFLYDSFIRFDWGMSWTYNVPVMQELVNRLPYTLIINMASMILSTVLAIPLGISCAKHQGKWQDYGIIALCMVLVPAFGCTEPGWWVLPIVTSMIGGIAGNTRQTRSAVLEKIRADFVVTARAKGVPEQQIMNRHVFPNALMPIITIVGSNLANVVCGSAITEQLFAIPGVGRYLLDGINYRDYPIIRGCVLFFAIFTAVVMLLTDLVYAWVDPRIKAQYSGGSSEHPHKKHHGHKQHHDGPHHGGKMGHGGKHSDAVSIEAGEQSEGEGR
jgi:peptide/nickel transport system permease protein